MAGVYNISRMEIDTKGSIFKTNSTEKVSIIGTTGLHIKVNSGMGDVMVMEDGNHQVILLTFMRVNT